MSGNWPILTRYDQDHLAQIALPLGGIGTGTVSLGGRGDLRDWEIMNRPAKGFRPQNTFFAIRAQPAGQAAVTRALEVVLPPPYEGARGATHANHGLPRFRQGSFVAAYPFGQVFLSDPDVPVDVRLEAFNPLIPADADASGIPVAVLRFVMHNRANTRLSAAIVGSLQNIIGFDGTNGAPQKNVNVFRQQGDVRGVFLHSDGVDPCAEQYGTIALTTITAGEVTHRTAWAQGRWSAGLLDFWDDFSDDGRLDERAGTGEDAPQASLALRVELAPGESRALTFLLTWHFPNRHTWSDRRYPAQPASAASPCCEAGCACGDPNRVGNYYTTQYADAWDVATRTAAALPELEAKTLSFVRAVLASDIPDVVKEAALYNLSTLRSQTTFRIESGQLMGWEGCDDRSGCCSGSCTHVWNYEQATAFLFGDLAWTMREIEFIHGTDEQGLMSFRINLPLAQGTALGRAAADGQMGCLIKLYREWQLSGNDERLRRLWPKAKQALAFCWIPGGWDADRDGVMEGCQHNTMDVEYYGPNPQMGSWYLGALRAAEEMARYLGDEAFGDTCRDLFERGSAWLDANLFNGEYYEHQVWPPMTEEAIAPGLRSHMGATNLADPELQLGPGCLVDQLVGQYMAHVCGLGYLLDPEHVRATLRAIMKHNWRDHFYGHFNNMRSYVLNDESALLMGTYPRGNRPKYPFPYYNEVMTGFEYTAAVHMLYEGQIAEGLKVIAAIRARYDGQKRSPFDEAECGHHYARAMASWGAPLALTGFHYSAVEGTLAFAAADRPTQAFWSNGYAWGMVRQEPQAEGIAVTLQVLHGALAFRRLTLTGAGSVAFGAPVTLQAGEVGRYGVKRA